jgi:hypothetical protein
MDRHELKATQDLERARAVCEATYFIVDWPPKLGGGRGSASFSDLRSHRGWRVEGSRLVAGPPTSEISVDANLNDDDSFAALTKLVAQGALA